MNEMLHKNKLCSVVSEVVHLLTTDKSIMGSFEINIEFLSLILIFNKKSTFILLSGNIGNRKALIYSASISNLKFLFI